MHYAGGLDLLIKYFRTVILKYNRVAALFAARIGGGPAHLHGAHKLTYAHRQGTPADFIGNEMGAGDNIEQNMAQQEGQRLFVLVLRGGGCKLSADYLRGVLRNQATILGSKLSMQ